MAGEAAFGELLWRPPAELVERSALRRYLESLGPDRAGASYEDAWRWSVENLEEFWGSMWRWFNVQSSAPFESVLADRHMPGARWFPGARLNWAEHVLRAASADRPALVFVGEGKAPVEVSWSELRQKVASLATALQSLGVERGDRVAALLPNTPEAVIGVLACASIGAIWSSCGPDFGVPGIVDRFRQIEPKALIAIDGYPYGGKVIDRRDVVAHLVDEMPSVHHVVHVAYQFDQDLPADTDERQHHDWARLVADTDAELTFDQVPFDHPLWILYSSGTTGLPKGIVHGHGGILLEQYKSLAFHFGIEPGDRFFWYSSTSWMMWNVVVGSLLHGATAVLYDGSPAFPDVAGLWRLADAVGLDFLGTSAGYLMACEKAGIRPGEEYDLSRLRSIGSTGSPLPPTGFRWVYDAVGAHIWLNSLSGGTDVCSAFVGGNPLLPVYSGEIQCRGLGNAVEAWDAGGKPVVGEVGELVITAPMPSMPVFFWNDPDGHRYHDAYFDHYPGIWRHGDWCTLTEHGGIVIHGRSDSTLNRQGVRMGSADIYEVVEKLPEIRESLVIGVELPDGGYWMPLFVHLAADAELDDELRAKVVSALRSQLSPRHVPDELIAVPGVPHTKTGKRLEVPVKRLLSGGDAAASVNLGTVDDPALVRWFIDFAASRSIP